MNDRLTQQLTRDLKEIVRISQCGVDYATKAYASGRIEFARHASRERKELNRLVQNVFADTSELQSHKTAGKMRLPYNEVIRSISLALFGTCQHAYEVASRATELTKCGVLHRSHDLLSMGERVNGLMRLCVVSLMNKDAEHAETVLRRIADWRYGYIQKAERSNSSGSFLVAGRFQERLIEISFLRMIENLHAIALTLSAYCYSLKGITVIRDPYRLCRAS